MNPAGRINMLLDLYRQGMLCSCVETEVVCNALTDEPELEVVHNEHCTARIKMMELLASEDKSG